MPYNVKENVDTSECTKKLVLEVPREDVNGEITKAYDTVRQNVVLPGFRRGKAPLSLLQKRFGKDIEADAIKTVMQSTLEALVKDLSLAVVGEPKFSEITHEGEDPLQFTLEVEHVPSFDLGDYRSHGVTVEPKEAGEAEVGRVLERLRESSASLKTLEPRPAAKGDVAVIKVKAEAEGAEVPGTSHEHYQLELGEGRHIPGFEEAIVGMSPGERKDVTLTFPPDYSEETLQGKEAVFTIELLELKEKILPALDDEFAKDFGSEGGLQGLKDRVRANLQEEARGAAFMEARRALADKLLDQVRFATPPSMVEGHTNYISAMQGMELERAGAHVEDLGRSAEELRLANRTEGERQARLSLILNRIAQDAHIDLSEEEYLNYLIQLAYERRQNPEWFVQNVVKNNLQSYYRRRALENKVYNVLLGVAPAEPQAHEHVHGPECEHEHGHEHAHAEDHPAESGSPSETPKE